MYYKGFTVTGVANVTTYDAGLVSLVDEPVRVEAVIINVSAYEGNWVEAWIGTERILDIPDYCLDTQEESTATQAPLSAVKMGRIPIERDIPAGQIFKIAIRCGAVLRIIIGAYEYTKKA